MPEVTRRRTGELLRKLFVILRESPEGIPAGEALREVAAQVKLSPYEAGSYASGGRRFETIIRYATVDCVKASWLTKSHGRWIVTSEGLDALKKYADDEAFYKRAVELYHAWKKQSAVKDPEVVAPDDAQPDKTATITFEQAQEQAWSEIERHLTSMPPYEFQELVASLLRGMGYHVGWVAPPGKDGGVDIVAFNDPLGTRPPRIKVQVKRQQQRISVDGVRSFMAVLAAEDVGLFVNTGGFTKDAVDEARSQQVRRITLIDLERLFDLWTEHYASLDQPAKRRLPLEPIWFLAPEG